MKLALYTTTFAAALFVASCGGSKDVEDAATYDAPQTVSEEALDTTSPEMSTAEASYETAAGAGTLVWAASGPWRIDAERDAARNPVETLEFFEVQGSDTVVEISPGGGWYTSVIAPYLRSGGGKLVAAHFDPAHENPYFSGAVKKYQEQFIDQPDTYGDIELTVFSNPDGFAEDGSADVVLTFRNVHNWIWNETEKQILANAYDALKPGGILGVVEHRLPSTMEQDPKVQSAYMHEEWVKSIVVEAGFEFVASSEVNANPADTADHPFGVWTLPPVARTSPFREDPNPDFDRTKYDAIGESDRMTLKFRKPVG